ncbi:hypothetical protein BDA96_03G415900 [Sorghum bicolor]|uniref:Uncharacterized protein n=2 Tax=Sorghum bicolor TaxID=4558 RepID=A0A1W0W0W6_SORBI|nr:hypothetical protein BDA96_03G415900 [Sorghum bicolor]OQU88025.1 hypothetical protein SORBI_3003G385401 [Sorghum bicolor]OQU88027.1 hypothetical protein SORBI_3003G385401 [Sorghum bicolor]
MATPDARLPLARPPNDVATSTRAAPWRCRLYLASIPICLTACWSCSGEPTTGSGASVDGSVDMPTTSRGGAGEAVHLAQVSCHTIILLVLLYIIYLLNKLLCFGDVVFLFDVTTEGWPARMVSWSAVEGHAIITTTSRGHFRSSTPRIYTTRSGS